MSDRSRPSVDRFDHLFIAASDYEKSLAFYRDVLNWGLLTTWGDEKTGRGAVLSGGGIKVVIAEKHRVEGDGKPHPNLHLDIHSVDLRYKLMPKGDHIVVPPESTHWGTKWFVVRDPDGNLIAFEEHPRGG
jgi:catechol 2,3-dioxygenase-like lactoylglutathione lyase family enzyme